MLQYGRDTYSYMWPRDAAMSAIALVKAGDFNASKRFFEFCNDVITDEGYFMHKYRPDKSVGSSWHPWIREGKPQLPIQEDETALVINALWKYFEHSKDLEFVESIYNSLVKNAAEFMVSYRNEKTGLPKPSYDLWEMKYGTHTFTAASVYGALEMASRFAKLLGKEKSADKYLQAAAEIKDAIIEHLYDEKEGVFVKSSFVEDGKRQTDKTIDISSVYGVYNFGVLEMDDERLKKAFEKTIDKLSVKTDVGGIARFEGDSYHSRGGNIPGNPWLITTLWTFQNRIAQIKEESEIPEIVEKLMWVEGKAQASGVLPEQLDPYSGDQVSAAPLTWSHAEYVITVIQYLEKLEELDICKACYPLGK
jgi:GH15 family glucan-1,4-alpha-glucosidase